MVELAQKPSARTTLIIGAAHWIAARRLHPLRPGFQLVDVLNLATSGGFVSTRRLLGRTKGEHRIYADKPLRRRAGGMVFSPVKRGRGCVTPPEAQPHHPALPPVRGRLGRSSDPSNPNRGRARLRKFGQKRDRADFSRQRGQLIPPSSSGPHVVLACQNGSRRNLNHVRRYGLKARTPDVPQKRVLRPERDVVASVGHGAQGEAVG